MKFIKNEDIELTAEKRLNEYELKIGNSIQIPIPIEKIVGQLYGLTIDWDTIEEFPGEILLGGLQPYKRVIVLNESHLDLFQEKPGLENSTIGHEAGHWEFHIDKFIIDQPQLFSDSKNANLISHRKSSNNGTIQVSSTINLFQYLEGVKRHDTSDQERVANRFAAALMMPQKFIKHASKSYDLLVWKNLYSLSNQFQVTISALTTRLQQLNYIYIDKDKKIYPSAAEAMGQQSLF